MGRLSFAYFSFGEAKKSEACGRQSNLITNSVKNKGL
jgi:hypothetical protein